MKVALVHDYLREYGGAERVVEALHGIFPDAPLFTAYYNPKLLGSNAQRFKGWDIRTSWFNKLHLPNFLISPFRIFAPMMFESFDLSEYDLVISSCNIYFAKTVITKPGALHISYIHTPPRYLYGYTTSFNYKKNWLTRIGGELINHILRIYDFETSQRPDIMVANSKNVQERIKKFYRRDSVIIYPPVDVKRFKNNDLRLTNKKNYYLTVSRLVKGKGMEVVVEACAKLGVPLRVVGTGPELKNLKSKILNHNSNIEFLGQVSDDELAKLYAEAKATIVASEDEDFGIVPVESMAVSTPVIAPKAGGFLESIVDGKTGILYGGPGMVNVEDLMEAIKRFGRMSFKTEDLHKQAEKFSKSRFKKEILALINNNLPQ